MPRLSILIQLINIIALSSSIWLVKRSTTPQESNPTIETAEITYYTTVSCSTSTSPPASSIISSYPDSSAVSVPTSSPGGIPLSSSFISTTSSTITPAATPTSSPSAVVPGYNGVPACYWVIVADGGEDPTCPVDYCNCGGTAAPLLTTAIDGSASTNCAYSTQPSSDTCPSPPVAITSQPVMPPSTSVPPCTSAPSAVQSSFTTVTTSWIPRPCGSWVKGAPYYDHMCEPMDLQFDRSFSRG